MNRKQLMFLIFGIWSIITIIITSLVSKNDIVYVSSQLGIWIIALTIIIGFVILLLAIIIGIIAIYKLLGEKN